MNLTRNGASADHAFVDDVEGMELTLEIMSDRESLGRISGSIEALNQGDEGIDVDTLRADLARRLVSGS